MPNSRVKQVAASALISASIVGCLYAEAQFLAPEAHADVFITCPSGLTGVVVGTPTSCAFADNVRSAWYGQAGNPVLAYSPVTGDVYWAYCYPTDATIAGYTHYNARECTAGDGALVVLW